MARRSFSPVRTQHQSQSAQITATELAPVKQSCSDRKKAKAAGPSSDHIEPLAQILVFNFATSPRLTVFFSLRPRPDDQFFSRHFFHLLVLLPRYTRPFAAFFVPSRPVFNRTHSRIQWLLQLLSAGGWLPGRQASRRRAAWPARRCSSARLLLLLLLRARFPSHRRVRNWKGGNDLLGTSIRR